MSRYACMIDSQNPASVPLDNGTRAGFMPLSLPGFAKWRPEGVAHSEPAMLEAPAGEHLRIGDHVLHREIFDLVKAVHGPCKWAHSLVTRDAFAPDGTTCTSPILWAWSDDGVLRCIAAATREREEPS